MEWILLALEIFDRVSCLAAICVGIALVPYSIYRFGAYLINKSQIIYKKIKGDY